MKHHTCKECRVYVLLSLCVHVGGRGEFQIIKERIIPLEKTTKKYHIGCVYVYVCVCAP